MPDGQVQRMVHNRVAMLKTRLIKDMKSLGEELIREAELLEKSKGFDYTMNIVGVVQGRGSKIDILCARYEDVRDIYKLLVLDEEVSERLGT